MKNFETKSNQPTTFESGSQRDSQEGKTRYDLIPPKALARVAGIYSRGAELYGEWNWVKGQPYARLYASALRHLYQWRDGKQDEDHLAAATWNLLALLYFDETDRDDLNDLEKI